MTLPVNFRRVVALSCWAVMILLGSAAGAASATTARAEQPRLVSTGGATQLVVNGAPFMVFGGELGNSSASSAAYMAPLWPKLQALQLNTVLAPVYWKLVEPEPGKFEFASVDRLLTSAREHRLKFILLWFGSWKNSMSSYAPTWIKRDVAGYPRALSHTGEPQESLTRSYDLLRQIEHLLPRYQGTPDIAGALPLDVRRCYRSEWCSCR